MNDDINYIVSKNKAEEYERKKTMKIIPKETRPGMIQITKNMLFTFYDIQEACIKLGYDNHKMLDELTGFPNGKDKCIGVLEKENK
jgi:hypothetical protein